MQIKEKIQNQQPLDIGVAIVRIALGIVLMVGGFKLAFPEDPEGLVDSYTAADGWIAPLFVDWIGAYFPVDVLGFLNTMGWLEMLVGLALVLGGAIPWVAALAGVMFLSFAISNPDVGMIRIAKDVSMAAFAFAIAYTGSGRFSIDGLTGLAPSALNTRRDWFLGAVRLGLLYAFVMAVMFPLGVGEGVLNETAIAWAASALIAVLLMAPRTARLACGMVALWMAALVLISMFTELADQGLSGLYWGLDATKRQLGVFAAGLAYLLTGPDEVSLWPPGK